LWLLVVDEKIAEGILILTSIFEIIKDELQRNIVLSTI
jgi:hypothetical protein